MEYRRVFFLGHGYECVRFVVVEANTNLAALEKAEEWYKTTGQTFGYMEMEVDKYFVQTAKSLSCQSYGEKGEQK